MKKSVKRQALQDIAEENKKRKAKGKRTFPIKMIDNKETRRLNKMLMLEYSNK